MKIDRVWAIIVSVLLGFLVTAALLPTRWEYESRFIDNCIEPTAELNKYGADGWELLESPPRQTACNVMMKRKAGL
jgi:hypothetical protein